MFWMSRYEGARQLYHIKQDNNSQWALTITNPSTQTKRWDQTTLIYSGKDTVRVCVCVCVCVCVRVCVLLDAVQRQWHKPSLKDVKGFSSSAT